MGGVTSLRSSRIWQTGAASLGYQLHGKHMHLLVGVLLLALLLHSRVPMDMLKCLLKGMCQLCHILGWLLTFWGFVMLEINWEDSLSPKHQVERCEGGLFSAHLCGRQNIPSSNCYDHGPSLAAVASICKSVWLRRSTCPSLWGW